MLEGVYHINRIKKASALTPTGIVDLHQDYLDTVNLQSKNSSLIKKFEICDNDAHSKEVLNDHTFCMDCQVDSSIQQTEDDFS